MADQTCVQEAIDVLNRLHAADPSVLPTLIAHRVPCNKEVAEDPSIQVGLIAGKTDQWEVGFLGLINGLYGVDARGWGFIAAEYNDQHQLTGFSWTPAPKGDTDGGQPGGES